VPIFSNDLKTCPGFLDLFLPLQGFGVTWRIFKIKVTCGL